MQNISDIKLKWDIFFSNGNNGKILRTNMKNTVEIYIIKAKYKAIL